MKRLRTRLASAVLWLASQLETLAYLIAGPPPAVLTTPSEQLRGARHAAILDAHEAEGERPLMITGRIGGHLAYTRLKRQKYATID